MRVLQLSKFYPPEIGGIESLAWELTEGLNRRGVTTDVLCASTGLRGSKETTCTGYRIHRVGSLGRLLSMSLLPGLPFELAFRAPRYDLIHMHMPDPMAAAALWFAKPVCPVVVHWHSDVVRQRWSRKAYEPLQRWLLERADALIATSPPYRDSSVPLRDFRHKTSIVPIGISDHRPLARTDLVQQIRQQYRGRHIVFALGRMTYYKGFDVLIRASALLPDDVVVVIGGHGELLEAYRRQARDAGLAGKVWLPGHIGEEELPSYLAACDVFCMASTMRAEAYGVAILEAMAMGRPIVACRIDGSGVPWLNRDGDTGINVPPGDPQALGLALTSLLQDPLLRERMGRRARQRYETELSADVMTLAVLALYQRLMQGPAPTADVRPNQSQ